MWPAPSATRPRPRTTGDSGRDFLERCSRDQLIAIAKDCGYAEGVGSIGPFKKSELVSSVLRHFAHAHAADETTPSQRKAREWLPEARLFPGGRSGRARAG